jgi:hypothetical protein
VTTEYAEAYQAIAQRLLVSTISDYIKLQHPKSRRNKDLREAFASATDMLFDETYQMLPEWVNDDDEPMSLKDIAKIGAERGNVDIDKLREHVLAEAETFWDDQNLEVVEIPKFLIVDGHTYHVLRYVKAGTTRTTVTVDLEKKLIIIPDDKLNTSTQEQFAEATLEILFHHNKVKLPKGASERLGRSFFRLLRQNDCFRSAQ